ncbi:MAG TPA: condensation domain-containing protein, partial [Gammaproteobacteria bacterium]
MSTTADRNHPIYKESNASSRPVDFDPFADAPELVATAPATEPQQEIWAAASLGREASCAYNESLAITLDGELAIDALRAALRTLVARHESLRASFGPDGHEICIARDIPLDLDVIDAHGAAGMAALREREVSEPFDLLNGPLFRCRIVRLEPRRHVVLFTAHHTICDGWSFGLLLRELAALYNDARAGRAHALPDAPSFTAYAASRRAVVEADGAEHDAWWVEQLRDVDPQLELPHDHARPAGLVFDAGFHRHVIPAAIMQKLKSRGAKRGATAYGVIAGSFAAWLHRLTGKNDLVLGVPAAGQAREGIENLVGHCVSLLPVRSRLDANDHYERYLERFSDTLSDAWEHRDCSMGRILPRLGLHRDVANVPLVQVILNVDRRIGELAFDGLDANVEGVPRRFENFEMFVNAVETPGGLRLDCTYDATLFKPGTIRARFAELEAFLERVADEDGLLAGIPIVTEDERARLKDWGEGPSHEGPAARIDALVRGQAEQTPHAIAISCNGRT